MIHPDEALAIIRSQKREPLTESVPITLALGRILPATVLSSMDQPPFSKAAVDGWGWQAAGDIKEPEAPLRVGGTIAAGSEGQAIGPGQTVRIMTGAPVPAVVNRIQSFEYAREADGFVTFTSTERGSNIIRQAENAAAGDILLTPRTLGAQDVAILAADGQATVAVARRLVVGVISTGTELAEPGTALHGAQIYDSNRPQIISQLASPSWDIRDMGHLPDNFEATSTKVAEALAACDVLLLSGGVSMGDFDYVPRALIDNGVRTLFHGIAVKPGKPTYFGRTDSTCVIGLPGNPVSVFVNVETLVRELLYALAGIEYHPRLVPVPVAEEIRRRSTERVEYLPVRIDADGVRAVQYSGSSGLQALGEADGFVRLEIGQSSMERGTMTRVRLVR